MKKVNVLFNFYLKKNVWVEKVDFVHVLVSTPTL